MRKKILLVAYYYPPFNNVASRRWAEMIPEIERKNEIYVFTQNSKGDLDNPITESKIKRVGYIENLNFHKKKLKRSLVHSIISFFTEEIRTIDSTVFSWFFKYKSEFLKYFEEVKPDIVITTIGPFSSILFGKHIKKKYPNIYWIIDIRDSFGLFNKNRKNFIQNFIDRIVDKWCIKNSDLLITVSDSLSIILQKFYNKKIEIIYNGFSLKQNISNTPKKTNKKKILYYAGKIYPHREPSLFLLFDSIKHLQVNFRIRLVDTQIKHNYFIHYLKKQNIKNVEILAPTTADVIKNEEKNADILIVLEDLSEENEITKGTLTAKIFEYLQFNASILAICRKDSDIRKLLSETNRGKVVSSKEEIQKFITSDEDFSLKDLNQIKKYSRENQARNFLSFIEKKLNDDE